MYSLQKSVALREIATNSLTSRADTAPWTADIAPWLTRTLSLIAFSDSVAGTLGFCYIWEMRRRI